MSYWNQLIDWLGKKNTLLVLFSVNFLGTIYGFYWYWNQLAATEWWWWPFVPDSPTASLFFTVVLFAFLIGKKWRYAESFAAVTLFKYGIWATAVIIAAGLLGGELHWQHYMLITSHLGMAVQALVYIPYYSFRLKHWVAVGIWTISNDLLDYSQGIFPWMDPLLHPYLPFIFIFTLGLSLSGLAIFYICVVQRQDIHPKRL